MSSPRFYLVAAVLALIALLPFSQFELQSPVCAPDGAAPTPIFSHPPGFYDQSISLTLSPPCRTAEILFEIDGRIPQESSPSYRTAFQLDIAKPHLFIIRARTLLADGRLSEPTTHTYFMGWDSNLPLVSLVVEPESMWSEAHGIYANFRESGRAWERPAHLTYLDQDRVNGFEIGAGVRIHGQASRRYPKKSLRLYFRSEYDGRVTYPLFEDESVTTFSRLVLHSGGQDNTFGAANWTLLRTLVTNELAAEMNLHTGQDKPVLLFINGALWGVYNLRERPDERFFEAHFGQGNVAVVDSPYRAEELSQARDNFDLLNNLVETLDLTDPEAYAYLQTQVDIDNLIDHAILQFYTANSDWPHNNDLLFRSNTNLGRWNWFLWDVDYSFGLFPSSRLDFDMVAWIMEPERNAVERSGRILRELLQVPAFRERFLARVDELLSTTLSPAQMVVRIERWEAAVARDMLYEQTRWSSSGNWEANVTAMKQFAAERPALVRQHIIDGLQLSAAERERFGRQDGTS